ncbi:hypothetical protein ACJMK2_036870 [Sinanodonta woodiana]|uniref:MD-2-related lipid-recognition domain-containing protein n=1 Tax=Sinanodonta woodiana TaxID=1069815 RepID=A0ABD3WIK1_SINWO
MFLVVVSLIFSGMCACAGEPIMFTSCNVPGTIASVDVYPCPSQPCIFRHGINGTVKVTFKTVFPALSLKTELYAILAGVSASLPLPNPDGCKDSGITCPIKAGSLVTYHTTVPVLKQYPSLRLVVKWVLRDENNNMQFCFQFPIEIK